MRLHYHLVNHQKGLDKLYAILESLTPKDFRRDLKHLNGLFHRKLITSDRSRYEDLLKDLKFLTLLSSTGDWAKGWKDKVEILSDKYQMNLLVKEVSSPINSKLEFSLDRQSFMEYVMTRLSNLRSLLNLNYYVEDSYLVDSRFCFDDLNYKKELDAPYNDKETYFIKDKVLVSHSTCYLSHLTDCNVLDFFRVFRRENVDKTHLCQFTQLQYQKIYNGSDPVTQMKKDILLVLKGLGLDLDKVQFRNTRYPYTAPSFQIHYEIDSEETLELGGCGVMRHSITKDNNTRLAFGIGLDRCYMIKHDLSSINEVHNLLR